MKNATKKLAGSALFAALSVVLARLFGLMPEASMRFSIEAVPLFLGGACFGPLYGAMIGFVADFVGCLFSGYVYNPIFCLPPILYGVCGGLMALLFRKDMRLWKIAVGYLPPVLLGSIFWQSFTLASVYGDPEATLWESYLYFLTTRSIQFAVTYVVDVAVTWILCRSNLFYKMGYLPKWKKKV